MTIFAMSTIPTTPDLSNPDNGAADPIEVVPHDRQVSRRRVLRVPAGRPARYSIVGLIVAGLIVTLLAFAGSANAVVNTNGLQRDYSVGDNCTFRVGDRALPRMWAQGGAQVFGCAHTHTISTYVELYRAAPGGTYTRIVTSNVLTTPSPAYGSDNWTNAWCGGGGAYFYTKAWVAFDGSGWYGPYYSYVNNSPFAPGAC